MPAHMSFEEGSTLTIAAATAWSSLYGYHPKLQAGDTVLYLGTGGVSLFAAQVSVISLDTTCSAPNIFSAGRPQLLREGNHHVVLGR